MINSNTTTVYKLLWYLFLFLTRHSFSFIQKTNEARLMNEILSNHVTFTMNESWSYDANIVVNLTYFTSHACVREILFCFHVSSYHTETSCKKKQSTETRFIKIIITKYYGKQTNCILVDLVVHVCE